MSAIAIEFVEADWERFPDVLALSFSVLYEPFGLSLPAENATRGADWLHPESGTLNAVAVAADGSLLGSARLLPAAGDESRQVRQVAVFPHLQGTGVGRALMAALEARAAEESAQEVWLNARNTAYGFYERLGYAAEGPEFVSAITGIPHRLMRKRLR